LIIYDKKNPTS
jgi:Amt family ammonium transporter